MDYTELSKWLLPIEKVTDAEMFAYHFEKGLLYGELTSRQAALLEEDTENSPWTVVSFMDSGELQIGIHKKGHDIDALLSVLKVYICGETGKLRRDRAFSKLINQEDDKSAMSVRSQFYNDTGSKVWVWIQSPKNRASHMESLLMSLGHRDCLAVSESRVALLLHLNKDDDLLELIEGLHRLIEEDLYETAHMGISQMFTHYDLLEEVMTSAECALKACKFTIDKKSWCFAEKDILTMILANPGERKVIADALNQQGIRTLMGDSELIYTLECFLKASLSPTDAALKLFIHRNTLLYRLNKIEKLTGLDPRCFSDAINLFTMVCVEKGEHAL